MLLALNQISSDIYDTYARKNSFEISLKLLNSTTKTDLIGEIQNNIIQPNKKLYTIKSFILGSFISIILALIFGFFKAYKENNTK